MKIIISPQHATILISFQWFKSFAQTLKELVVVGTVVSYKPLTNVYLQIQTQEMGYINYKVSYSTGTKAQHSGHMGKKKLKLN